MIKTKMIDATLGAETIKKEIKTMKLRLKTLAIVTCFSAALASGSAMADGWPSSVAGTWTVVGNQSVGTLRISQYNGASGSRCKPIRGVIYSDNIEGFYCPYSGRISFLRYIGTTNNPKQHWSGNLSQYVSNLPLRIGGLFATFDHNNVAGTSGGSLGDYNFYAWK